jgi:hypothetical protein
MSEIFGNVVKLKTFGNVDNKLVKRLLDIIVEYDIAKKELEVYKREKEQ